MKLLITNCRLERRTGSELFACELARALCKRGHELAVYSPIVGELGEKLRAEGFEVVDTLAAVSFEPEVIHAQHHMTAMAALAHFANARAIYHCQGYLPWEEWPPQHPRISSYAAPSAEFQEWFTDSYGISAGLFRATPLAVDTDAFPHRETTGWPLKRALIYSNYFEPGPSLDALAAACKSRDIKLDAKGRGFGTSTDAPHELLPGYDLVFASGRSAVEAAACGCGVIITYRDQHGGALTADNLELNAGRNFGVHRDDAQTITEASICAALDGLSSSVVRSASDAIREGHDIDRAASLLESLYTEAVGAPTGDGDENAALIKYMEQIAGHVLQADSKFSELRDGWEQTKAKLRSATELGQRSKAGREALIEQIRSTRKGRAVLREIEEQT